VVVEAVRPSRPAGRGGSWQACEAERDRIKGWLEKDLEVTKIHDLLGRRGVEVPYRTLHRFCAEELGYRRQPPTVPVVDGEPSQELQIDFGRMGLMFDVESGRRRAVWALIFTAVLSRHMFVWLSFRQTLEDVIEGCEAAWAFFDGIFAVVIPDNMKAIVDQADPLNPRINPTFLEYAQARGFVIDPARVQKPTDKPRVEPWCHSCADRFGLGRSSPLCPMRSVRRRSGRGGGPGCASTAPSRPVPLRCSPCS
jgi:hypothetical protein